MKTPMKFPVLLSLAAMAVALIAAPHLANAQGATQASGFFSSAGNPVYLGSGNTTLMTILTNGNVGIGTAATSPHFTLDVAGDIGFGVGGYIAGNVNTSYFGSGSILVSGAAANDTGILTAGNIVFGTNAGAGNYERMRITSAGFVGVGSTNPTAPLNIAVTSEYGPALAINATSFNGTDARANLTLGGWSIGQDLNATGAKDFYIYDDANTPVGPRFYISTTGHIGINTTTPYFNSVEDIEPTTNNSTVWGELVNYQNFTGGGAPVYGLGAAGSTYALYGWGPIVTTTSFTGPVYYHSSDVRLKTDIKPVEHALDKILALQGVTFNWKKDGRGDMGVTAQNVVTVFPDIVTKSQDGMMSVEYDSLIGPMIEAIRELNAKNEKLEGEVADLKKALNVRAAAP